MSWLACVARPWYAFTKFINHLRHLPGRREAQRKLAEFRDLGKARVDIVML